MNNLQMMHKISMGISLISANVDNLAVKDDVKSLCACMTNMLNILGECPFVDQKAKFVSEDAFMSDSCPKTFREHLSIANQAFYEGDEILNRVFGEDDENEIKT